MNNEPIAWMVAEMVFTIKESAIEMAKVYEDEVIPLYTHPAKTLTDEEILVFEDANGNELKVDTGKWKLRKAQEK